MQMFIFLLIVSLILNRILQVCGVPVSEINVLEIAILVIVTKAKWS